MLPLLLIGGGGALFVAMIGVFRFVKVWRRRRAARGEAEMMLSAVDGVIRGIRENESDLRDLYSRAERRASFLDRYHHSILESMATGVLACNRMGEITALNRAAEMILRIERGRGRGSRLGAVLGKGNLFETILEKLIRTGSVEERIELKLKDSTGEPTWIELRISPVKGSNGQVAGATFLLDDITDRKMMRRRIELKDRLAAMGEVSAGITHEFRNALHALNGFAKLIARRANGNSRIESLAEEILRENRHLERMLNDLLGFLKPEGLRTGRIEVEPFLESLITPFRESSPDRSIRFGLSIRGRLPTLKGDRAMLARALRNLVENAVNAVGKEGEVTVRVSAIRPRRGGATPRTRTYLVIAVEDSGPGIAPEARGKIFQPFYTTRSEGTGLGLPMVQKAVAAHGGCIEVDNTPAGGGRFTVILPAMEEEPTVRGEGSDAASTEPVPHL